MPSYLVFKTTESTNPIPSYVRAVYVQKPIIHHCLSSCAIFEYQTFGCQATTIPEVLSMKALRVHLYENKEPG